MNDRSSRRTIPYFTGIGPLPNRPGRFWAAWMVAWLVVGGYGLARLAATPARPHDPRRAAAPRVSHAAPVPSPTRKTRSIEEIRPGDLVVARGEHSAEVQGRRVAQVFRKTADHLRIVRFRAHGAAYAQEVKTTDNHPFWVVGVGWVEAGKLSVGQELSDPDGGVAGIESVRREEHPEGVTVYNFEVEDAHTYFVAQTPSDKPILVHNSPDCFVRRGTSYESAQRLAKQAAAAEQAGTARNGMPYGHGVSVTTPESNLRLSRDPADAVSAARSSLEEAGFPVRHTPTGSDPNHHTVQLPKPVTRAVADLFNSIFGRLPGG